MSNFQVIPALQKDKQKKRVVGYARVSTADEHQDSSYRLQIQELEDSITQNPRFEFIGIFKDRKSGRNTKDRQEFNTMISLAMSGEIDVIVTKSITRFGRNLLETISLVRELKIHNVEVIFQKEGIATSDPSIEMILNVLAMHAEEESKNISDNTNWSFQRKMRRGGNFTVALYGYNINGETWTIDKKKAEIVRLIFDMYIKGFTYSKILEKLYELKVASPRGNKVWVQSALENILRNEKYAGHMALGKTYTINGVQVVSNKIDVANNTIFNHHEPIVDPKVFDKASRIRTSRTKIKGADYIPQSERNSPFHHFVYSTENQKHLFYVVEKPKGKYEIPTLYCYNNQKKNRVMITVNNLFVLLNDALGKLSLESHKLSSTITSLINTKLALLEHSASMNDLTTKVSLINAKGRLPSFIKLVRNYSIKSTIEEFKRYVRVVEMKDKYTYVIRLSLAANNAIDTLLLESKLNMKIGSSIQEATFYIFV
jgi:site-specific DNA recombinase